jgi:hypothetical protein
LRTRINGLAVCAFVPTIGLFGVPLSVDQRNEPERLADTLTITVADAVYDEDEIDDLARQGPSRWRCTRKTSTGWMVPGPVVTGPRSLRPTRAEWEPERMTVASS